MKFSEAYTKMRNGEKIKLPEWKGYWVWENNTIMIHCGNGEVLNILDTQDVSYTFGFICREDWTVKELDEFEIDQEQVKEKVAGFSRIGDICKKSIETGEISVEDFK